LAPVPGSGKTEVFIGGLLIQFRRAFASCQQLHVGETFSEAARAGGLLYSGDQSEDCFEAKLEVALGQAADLMVNADKVTDRSSGLEWMVFVKAVVDHPPDFFGDIGLVAQVRVIVVVHDGSVGHLCDRVRRVLALRTTFGGGRPG